MKMHNISTLHIYSLFTFSYKDQKGSQKFYALRLAFNPPCYLTLQKVILLNLLVSKIMMSKLE